MNKFSSPFINEIKDCKASMRKLRKKIYKHSLSAKNAGKIGKDITTQITDIIKQRNLPDFILESLKKRRNFDLSSIKNINTPVCLPLEELRHLTNFQESEVKSSFFQHKGRMRELKREQTRQKIQKSTFLNQTPNGIYSSTVDGDQNSASISYEMEENENLDNSFYETFSKESKQAAFTSHYLNMINMESSLNSDMALFPF